MCTATVLRKWFLLFFLFLNCSCKLKSDNHNYLISSKFDKLPPYINFPEFGNCQRIPKSLRQYLQVPKDLFGSRKIINTSFKCADIKILSRKQSLNCIQYTKDGETIGYFNKPNRCTHNYLGPAAPYQNRYGFPWFRHFGDKIPGIYRWKRFKQITNNQNTEFILNSYQLPREYNRFVKDWKKQEDKLWILKPSNGTNSKGVRLISSPEQVPLIYKNLLIEKYISDPWVYQNKKIEYRFLVLVTRFHPLRIYTFPNINRFRLQSHNYTTDQSEHSDRCVHIRDIYKCKVLGYEEYCITCDVFNAMELEGGPGTVSRVISKIYMIVSQVLLQWEHENIDKTNYLYGKFQLIAFDWLFDSKSFQPKLVEINSNYIQFDGKYWEWYKHFPEIFHIIGYNLPPFVPSKVLDTLSLTTKFSNPVFYKYWRDELTSEEKLKQAQFESIPRSKYLTSILDDLTQDDIIKLMEMEDEYSRVKTAQRILPNPKMYQYFSWMKIKNTYYYKLMDAWENKYWNNRSEGIKVLNRLFNNF